MKKAPIIIAASFLLLSSAGCTPTHKIHGNFLKDHQIEGVEKGTDTQSDILRKLGSPTTVAPFNNNIWYYIGQETEKRGILDPEVKEERIVMVAFKNGYVDQITDVDNERQDIPYVRRETPTSGTEMNAVQQFLGNLGKFNAPESFE